ncbi:aspartyl/asparaginyl beta-hydroxylase domain-containing protein [bacterium]|nr:aspartyl/asparaginyl beta-hydroxylase domain-containing protein [bacterium]
MSVTKLDIDFDYHRLLSEFKSFDIERKLIDNTYQLAVQCREGVDTDQQLTDSCGSLVWDWDGYFPEKDYTNSGPKKRDVILAETQFDILCDMFKDTYIGEVVNTLQEQYDVVRGRFMMLGMKQCLTYHTDNTPRLHIPLVTHESCFMVIDDKVCRIPYPGTYKVDTTKKHTALNASKILRTHLVFVLPKPPVDKSKPLPWESDFVLG